MAMPRQYVQLLAQIRELTLLPESLLSQELSHLSIKGVDFSMYPVGEEDNAFLVTHCDLGALPDARREEVLMRLMDSNFHMVNSGKPVTFCRNEETGHMMLSAAQPFSLLSGQAILDQMSSLADYALAWRQTYFLSSNKPKQQLSARTQQAPAQRTVLSQRAL
jgi:hypothetical protein